MHDKNIRILFFQLLAISLSTVSDASINTYNFLSPSNSNIKSINISIPYPNAASTNNFTGTNISACPSTIICPDVNGNYPSGGSSATCPSSCTVTRNPSSDTLIINDPGTSVVAPACPAGYTQVYAYNSLQEFQATDLSTLTITSWTLFTELRTGGFSPNDTGSEQQWTSQCLDKSKSFNDDLSGNFWSDPNDFSQKYAYYNGQIVHIKPLFVRCYAAACGSSAGYNGYIWSDLAGATGGSNPGQGNDCGSGVAKKWTYYYHTIQFTGLGQYPTGQRIPGTIVCSHVSPQWSP